MDSFLLEATIYLAAAVIAVPIATRFGMGSVLGYLLAGLVIGPITGIAGTDPENLRHFGEFGVVMMLFLIGLELDPRALWDMRHRLIGLGGLQIGLTGLAVFAAALAMGLRWETGVALGMMLSLSSTAIVLQTLTEKGLIQTAGGRSSFSVLLAQDIAVIPMLALVPLLAGGAARRAAEDHSALSLVAGLPGWAAALVTLGAVMAVILGGRFLVRPMFHYIDAARLREVYTAFALLIVVGIAVLMSAVGLSPALGAFLAGVVLANSEFRHELESDIQPFKGLLLGLFFITVGAGMDLPRFFASPLRLIGLTLALMLAKGVVLYVLARIFKLRGRDQWLFTLGLAQAGEFGFVLASFSQQLRVFSGQIAQDVLTVIALSMLFTPLVFIAYDRISKRRADSGQIEPDQIDEQHNVIIVGIGRFGQIVNRLVRSAGFSTTVLDSNLKTIQLMRRFGVKSFLGDPTRADLLRAAGLAKAKVLVVAVNRPEDAVRIVRHARAVRPDIHIVARARDRNDVYALNAAGADDVVREMFDSSLRAGRYVLENIGLSEFEASEVETAFFKHDRETIRELSALWKPGVHTVDNDAYIKRAVELQNDLETALLTQLEGDDPSRSKD